MVLGDTMHMIPYRYMIAGEKRIGGGGLPLPQSPPGQFVAEGLGTFLPDWLVLQISGAAPGYHFQVGWVCMMLSKLWCGGLSLQLPANRKPCLVIWPRW